MSDDPGAVAEPVVADEIEERFGAPLTRSRGDEVLHVAVDDYAALVAALHAAGYMVLIDITAVDYLVYEPDRALPATVTPERFEVVVQLLDPRQRRRIRVRCQVPEGNPVVPSLWGSYPGAEAPEREVFDMFGISFTGHPDLTRILMPEDWVGHPLRKDEHSGRIPVQFTAAATGPAHKDAPAPR